MLIITVKKSGRRYKWNANTNCKSNLLSSVTHLPFSVQCLEICNLNTDLENCYMHWTAVYMASATLSWHVLHMRIAYISSLLSSPLYKNNSVRCFTILLWLCGISALYRMKWRGFKYFIILRVSNRLFCKIRIFFT